MKTTLTLAMSMFMLLAASGLLSAQDDDFDDFDPSMFEEAGEGLKAFCTNKVLGQSPSSLISFGFDFQGPTTIGAGPYSTYGAEDIEVGMLNGFRFVSNVPILSKNNILINWGVSFVQSQYQFSNDNSNGPFGANLRNHSLKWMNTNFTIFKPLSERRFLLLQVGGELNGDYSFNNMPELNQLRVPAAFIYGFKPNDNMIWGPGISRTYLGGALNLLPVIYYYQTFKNPKWGVEALFPARVQARYRWNSRSVLLMGYQVEGATYRLSNFGEELGNTAPAGFNQTELRRSEIRLGLNYNKGLNDFIWIGAQAGYRINYSFNADDSEFFRGFDREDFFFENTLTNTLYAQFTISMVSP
ncbi:MAG: hypothetical protein ACJAZM_000088 [Cyclobacteriaceae bacterium]|jgi:hypothetical protein